MQVSHKPRLDKTVIRAFLAQQWSESVVTVENLVEGEDSQALYFDSDGRRYALRLNASDYGFQKDAYAYEHFASGSIPIPEIVQTGQFNADFAYCISEFVEGQTLQERNPDDIERLLPATVAIQRAIADVDVGHTRGYGEFDLTGNGKSKSWQEWLLTHTSQSHFDWDNIIAKGLVDSTLLNELFSTFRRLVDHVPNERRLIHGDFGSSNLLTHHDAIVAVLDWDCAGYGDWLFDMAGAYYWRDHLLCMKLAADYYERELNHLPNYRTRVTCYQLRAALIEIYVQASRGEQEKLEWHLKRCRQLLEMTEGMSTL